VPTGPQWAYEIKHDGFRFICHRDGERVRVFSRTGHEWAAPCNRRRRANAAGPLSNKKNMPSVN
jgi:ATP-dependent DNA ligase